MALPSIYQFLGTGGQTLTIPVNGVQAGHTIVLHCSALVNGPGLTAPPLSLTDTAGNAYAINAFEIGPGLSGGQAFFVFIASAMNVQPLLAGDQIQLHLTISGVGTGIVNATMDGRDWVNLGPSSFDGSAHQRVSGTSTGVATSVTAPTTYAPDAVAGVVGALDTAGIGGLQFTPSAGIIGAVTGAGTTQLTAELFGVTPAQAATVAGTVTGTSGATPQVLTCVATFQADRRIQPVITPTITNGLLASPDRWLVEIVPLNGGSWEIDDYHLSVKIQWRGLSAGQLDVPAVSSGYGVCLEGNYVVLTDLISGWQRAFVITDVHHIEAADKAEQKSCLLADLRYSVYVRNIAARQTGQTNNATSGTLTGTVEPSYAFTGSLYTPTQGWVSLSGTTESLCKTLVSQNCVLGNPLANFRVGGTQQKGVVQYLSVTGEPLSQRLPALLAVDDFGDTVRLNADLSLEYDVLKGVDRSAGTRNQQIFSVNLDTVTEIGYQTGRSGHINAVLVIGKAAADTAPNDGTGAAAVTQHARPMMWVEDSLMIAKHGRQEATYDAADAVVANDFIAAGLWYLAQHQEVNQLTFIASSLAMGRFGSGWDVGDLVTVEATDWNVVQNLRIQSVQIDTGNPDLKLDAAAETVNFMQYAEDTTGFSPANNPVVNPSVLPAAVTPALAQMMAPNTGLAEARQFHLQVTVGTPPATSSWRALPQTAIRRP